MEETPKNRANKDLKGSLGEVVVEATQSGHEEAAAVGL
jgi:hypothetical protein